jgi:hypothetical protein
VGRYAQHFVDALQMDSNPVEYLLNKYPKVGPDQLSSMRRLALALEDTANLQMTGGTGAFHLLRLMQHLCAGCHEAGQAEVLITISLLNASAERLKAKHMRECVIAGCSSLPSER